MVSRLVLKNFSEVLTGIEELSEVAHREANSPLVSLCCFGMKSGQSFPVFLSLHTDISSLDPCPLHFFSKKTEDGSHSHLLTVCNTQKKESTWYMYAVSEVSLLNLFLSHASHMPLTCLILTECPSSMILWQAVWVYFLTQLGTCSRALAVLKSIKIQFYKTGMKSLYRLRFLQNLL